jgi:hypothetical protein
MALAVLVLIGCSPGLASSRPSTQVEQGPVDTVTPVPQITPTEVVPSPIASLAETSSAPAEPTPTVREGLHATNPGSVVLASGKPQLVEFLAFW